MNDDPIDDASTYEAQAERARRRLADNLRNMTDVGEKMLRRTGRIGGGILIGLGALGFAALIVSRLRRRRRAKNLLSRYLPGEQSFFKQALRSVLLSVVSVLGARVAQRLPLPLPRTPAE
ncbi:MAG TPA: hypothetical protein VM686_16770 [Polyangiaceae bacterium]|nr:hypothetical protein [Polyangiaceae bacterium]